MSIVEQLEQQANANHADNALVAVPIATIRTIAIRLRRLEAAERALRPGSAFDRIFGETSK